MVETSALCLDCLAHAASFDAWDAAVRQDWQSHPHHQERVRSQTLKREVDDLVNKHEVAMARVRETHNAEGMQKDAQIARSREHIIKLELTIAGSYAAAAPGKP